VGHPPGGSVGPFKSRGEAIAPGDGAQQEERPTVLGVGCPSRTRVCRVVAVPSPSTLLRSRPLAMSFRFLLTLCLLLPPLALAQRSPTPPEASNAGSDGAPAIPVRAAFGQGVRFGDPEGDFFLKLRGRLQLRFTSLTAGPGSTAGSQNGFAVRRARLALEGHVL